MSGSGAKALVLGANGQDGTYLVEHLVAEGYSVTGVARQGAADTIASLPSYTHMMFDLSQGGPARREMIEAVKPDIIYHLAAVHGPSGFQYETVWQDALQVNTATVHDCLEYIRLSNPNARLAYTSSLKAFGASPPSQINEANPRFGSCLYSITKNASTDLMEVYRRDHGVRCGVYYVFNHDSPRRAPQYFLPRLCDAVAAAARGDGPITLNSLDFYCDWGSARQFMQVIAKTILLDANSDYVVASARTWNAAELADALFLAYDMDWREHVTLRKPVGSESPLFYQADISALQNAVGQIKMDDALDVAHWILGENHGLTPKREMNQ